MKIFVISDVEQVSTPLGGLARILVDNPDLKLVNLAVFPGHAVASHTAPVDIVFMVQEGKGRIVADNKSIEVKAGQVIICPSGVLRSIEAAQDEGLNLLVVRAPNP